MVTPISNDQTVFVGAKVPAGEYTGSRSQGVKDSSDSAKPYAEYVARLEKEKADAQKTLNDLIDEKDKLKKEDESASFLDSIAIKAKLAVKVALILYYSTLIERLTAKIKEYS